MDGLVADDARIGHWSLRVTAGTTRGFVATFPDGHDISGGVSVWIGGTVTPDTSVLTGATEVETSVAGQVASWAMTAPIDVFGSTPLRVTVGAVTTVGDVVTVPPGVLRSVGRLHVGRTGSPDPDESFSVAADPVSFTVVISGGDGVPGGATSLDGLTDVDTSGVTDGQVLGYDDGAGEWVPVDQTGGGGGAPTTADYLVGTTQGGLSAEIVVGATPGGELGGSWAAPTVDATHSGSSHAAVQAAAEATAAADATSKVAAEAAARASADLLLIPLSQKAANSGVAPLDSSGLVPTVHIPPLAITSVQAVVSQAAMLALTAQAGDVAVRTDLTPDKWFILTTNSPSTLADWLEITAAGAVTTVDGQTGTVSLAGVYAALAHSHAISGVTGLQAALDLLAPLAGPDFTGDATFTAQATTGDVDTLGQLAILPVATAVEGSVEFGMDARYEDASPVVDVHSQAFGMAGADVDASIASLAAFTQWGAVENGVRIISETQDDGSTHATLELGNASITETDLDGVLRVPGPVVFTTAPTVPADPYDATDWNGLQEPAPKDAVRDMREALPALEVEDDLTADVSDPLTIVIGRTPCDVQVFDASADWTKPTNATILQVFSIGGGSGGGSGAKGAAGGVRNGGGGGMGGFSSEAWIPAASVAGTVAVTIGPGGAGGAAVSTNSANGAASTAGTASTFGTHLSASGGPAVVGGAITGTGAGDALSTASNRRGSYRNSPGGNTASAATPTTALGGHVGSGGAGGGIDGGNTPRAGGSGGSGVGGTAGPGGAIGVVGVAGNTGLGTGGGGGGGGGGAASGATAGAGGAGATPGGGGGGGGAGVNSVADSGAGGAGAAGRVIVITYF